MNFPKTCIICGTDYKQRYEYNTLSFICLKECSNYYKDYFGYITFRLDEYLLMIFKDAVELYIAQYEKCIAVINGHYDIPQSKEKLIKLINQIKNNQSFM